MEVSHQIELLVTSKNFSFCTQVWLSPPNLHIPSKFFKLSNYINPLMNSVMLWTLSPRSDSILEISLNKLTIELKKYWKLPRKVSKQTGDPNIQETNFNPNQNQPLQRKYHHILGLYNNHKIKLLQLYQNLNRET